MENYTSEQELEISIFEKVLKDEDSKSNMMRKLLALYGTKPRFFYHYSPAPCSINVSTEELIECTKEFYDKIKANKKDSQFHKPITYISDSIPKTKIIRSILYTR